MLKNRLLPNNNRGVTLIEVLIAVTVLGILSGLVIYNWSSFVGHQNLRREAFSIFNEFASYKPLAIQENCQFRVEFDIANSSYTIIRVVDGDDDVQVSTRTLAQGVEFGAPAENENVAQLGDVNPVQGWTSAGAALVISPDNISAFSSGRIYIERNNRTFVIQKRDNMTTLELLYLDGDTWTRM